MVGRNLKQKKQKSNMKYVFFIVLLIPNFCFAQDAKENQAAQKLRKYGGKVVITHKVGVTEVSFANNTILKKEAFKYLAACPKLKSLDLEATPITDEWVDAINKLPIESVVLAGTPISEAAEQKLTIKKVEWSLSKPNQIKLATALQGVGWGIKMGAAPYIYDFARKDFVPQPIPAGISRYDIFAVSSENLVPQDNDFYFLLFIGEGLSGLSIPNSQLITDRAFENFRHLKNLNSFYMNSARNLTDAALPVLVKHCPNLKRIEMHDSNFTPLALENFSNLKNLTALRLDGRFIWQREHLEAITKCKSLQELGVEHCGDYPALFKMIQTMKQLKVLHISAPDEVNQQIKRLRPDLL
jgi:hypothetical protein